MSKRANQEINAGSMADIAFLLLIFYLVTTTMNVDSGIMRTLPPMSDEEQVEVKQKKRNILFVSINADDKILLNLREHIDITQLKDRAKKFILNINNDPELPEIETKLIEDLGRIRVSNAIVSLQNTNSTSYNIYVAVQNELTRAYNEIRDEYSLKYFEKKFANLNDDQVKAIRSAVPLRISEAEPKF